MSLDMVILGPDGSPARQMSISVDDHYRLMALAKDTGRLLMRLNNYYADAEFRYSELEDLAAEIASLQISHLHDASLLPFLNDLSDLIAIAKQEHKPIVAIAD